MTIPLDLGRAFALTLAIVATPALAACNADLLFGDGEPPAVLLEWPEAEEAPHPLKVTVHAPAEVAPGARVPVRLRLTNVGDGPVVLRLRAQVHGNPEPYDIFVATEEGEPVWSRLHGVGLYDIAVFPPPFQPGQVLEFEGSWNQRDWRGRRVPPGRYEIRGLIHGGIERLPDGERVSIDIPPVRTFVTIRP